MKNTESQITEQTVTPPSAFVIAYLNASDTLSMALDRIGALSLAIQERAEIEGSAQIVTLAHLAAELTKQAEHAYDQLRKADYESRTLTHRREKEREEGEAA